MFAAVVTAVLLTVFGVEGRVVLHHHQSKTDYQLNLRVSTPDNDDVYLTLTKVADERSSIVRSVPTYVSGKKPGRMVRWQEPEGYSLEKYTDVDSQASVVVQTTVDSAGKTIQRYRGSFSDGNRLYWLAPVMVRSSSLDGRADRFQPLTGSHIVRIGHVDHFVAPIKVQSDGEYDNIISSAKLREKSYIGRHDLRDKTTYTVELMMVNDYSLYQFWYNTYTNSTMSSSEREDKTTQLLQHYFAAVADQIDKRYDSINQPDFDIDVKLVGFILAKNAADSQYTEDSEVKVNYYGINYVQMTKCLGKFGKWIADNANLYGAFDHAVLFVGNYLYDTIQDGYPSTKSGLSNVGGVCKIKEGLATSINYERGFYSSCETGAHELAHNLGSAHDEENNECKGKDQYVMASAPGVLTDDILLNPYTFSQCSIRYFRDFLQKLASSGDNCLSKIDNASPISVQFQLPGVVQNVDQQCHNYQGKTSFYCAGEIHDAEICLKMICWEPDLKKCVWESSEHRAYAGTPCGNKKWCYMGRCTADDNALPMNASCIYGDYRGEMYLDENNKNVNCKDLITKFPEQCYNENKRLQCCNGCPSIRNADKPGCEYGDRTPARCKTGKKVNCYDKNFRLECCDWCEKQKGDDEKCIYGDLADWCKDVTGRQCYESNATCCESCRQFSTASVFNSLDSTNEGCEYGDKVDWCTKQDLSAKDCQTGTDLSKQCCGTCAEKFPPGASANSNDDNKPASTGSATCPAGDTADYCSQMKDDPARCYQSKDVCCATCEKLSSNIQGCEWGDKTQGCDVDEAYCKEPGVFDYCCQSCLKAKGRRLELLEKLLLRLG